MLMRVCGEL